jgi:hypothetical protein
MKQIYSILILTVLLLIARPAQSSSAIVTIGAQPIAFSSFSALKNSSGVLLTWGTPQEADNNNFEIQRSTDGAHWTVIVIVLGMGTASTASQYHFTDKNGTMATAYYRIRQVANGHQVLYTTTLQAAQQTRN